jgi:hypothetical protein
MRSGLLHCNDVDLDRSQYVERLMEINLSLIAAADRIDVHRSNSELQLVIFLTARVVAVAGSRRRGCAIRKLRNSGATVPLSLDQDPDTGDSVLVESVWWPPGFFSLLVSLHKKCKSRQCSAQTAPIFPLAPQNTALHSVRAARSRTECMCWT